MIKITIPETHPSLNDLIAWSKRHWAAYSVPKDRWKEMVVWCAKGVERVERAEVVVEYYFNTNRRRDIDNYPPKFIMDGLVAAGVFDDDSHKTVECLSVKIKLDKDNPRTEVLIYPL